LLLCRASAAGGRDGWPVPAVPPDPGARGSRYHHGDLRAALIDAATQLIAERGIGDFSVAEASRLLGVTTAAPYRHFADRDELIAAVATRGAHVLAAALRAGITGADAPEDQLAVMASAYVAFAVGHRPLFDALYNAGIDKSRYPDLREAMGELAGAFSGCVRQLSEDDAVMQALATAVAAIARGYAAMCADGAFGSGSAAVTIAAGQAAAATRALLSGRAAFIGSGGANLAGQDWAS
jgi:AcrR family transcriptional regulator